SRRRHTRWPRDWSSDVCSSDLGNSGNGQLRPLLLRPSATPRRVPAAYRPRSPTPPALAKEGSWAMKIPRYRRFSRSMACPLSSRGTCSPDFPDFPAQAYSLLTLALPLASARPVETADFKLDSSMWGCFD